MEPLWHPLSALLLPEPRDFVPPAVLRRRLARAAAVELVYAGDRMWPSVGHGDTVVVTPAPEGRLTVGAVAVVAVDGVPDLARIEGETDDGGALIGYDADPNPELLVPRAQVLGLVRLAHRRATARRRVARRVFLDLREALRGRLDPTGGIGDAADTVRHKYDTQAPFYGRVKAFELPDELISLVRSLVPPGAAVLVGGSGTGRESFRLEEEGFRVTGVDFSASMVEIARREAQQRGSRATFEVADLRAHELPAGSLGAVLFTYDVYSFLPEASQRVALLRKMAGWLAPGGVILLSARRLRTFWARTLLTLQWLAGGAIRGVRWGGSHTRWIAPDGSLHRSFVQHFSDRALRREARRAGLVVGMWQGGHCPLRRREEPR